MTFASHITVNVTILVITAPPVAVMVYVDVHVPVEVVGTDILLQIELSAAIEHPAYVMLPETEAMKLKIGH